MSPQERSLLELLETALQSAAVRARIDPIVEEVAKRLAHEGSAPMAWGTIPRSAFDGRLPPDIRSAWVFILRAGATTGAERHPNSHQRMRSYRGRGDLQTGGEGQWQSNLLSSEGVALNEKWVSVPPNVWHQASVADGDWVVVSFHTVPAEELIEERPAAGQGGGTSRRHYLDGGR